MTPPALALVLGLAYVGLGVLGLMPGVVDGLFPASPALAVVHLAMGAWGLRAYLGRSSAQGYARAAGFVFAALALAGMLQGMERFLGAYIWLHLATAAAAGFVGWRPRSGERRSLAGDRRRTRAAVGVERRLNADDRRSFVQT